jgi:DNA topoisomerase-1
MNRRRQLPVDPMESARLAGLHYSPVNGNGIGRRKVGRGWLFTNPDGTRVADSKELLRIGALVIPPAWTGVWIAPSATCHLQAVGYDARGRKQYRYHTAFRELRDSTKFGRILEFAKALPKLRQRVEQDLKVTGLPKEKVLATLVRLLDITSIRVGNHEYAKASESFGLTTLADGHVTFDKATMSFSFNGKSGVEHNIDIHDRRLAKIVRGCQEIPGQDLFQHLDEDGNPHKIRSDDVNAYIRELSGGGFTAKDFRTWNGTRAALIALRELGVPKSEAEAKVGAVSAVKQVAQILRNRPATCRKFYIHPAVLDAYSKGIDLCTLPNASRIAHPGLSNDEELMVCVISKWQSPEPRGLRRRKSQR